LKKYSLLRTATILALILFSLQNLMAFTAHGQSYNLTYGLSYTGTPFPGATISFSDNLTNTGQLTARVTSILFASDLWSNGTRQVTSGFPLNLTAGANKVVDIPALIPINAQLANHTITATANWQYSDSSGWHTAPPTTANVTVMVSQTIGSLFSGFATILLTGLGLIVAIAVSGVLLVVRRRRKGAKQTTSSTSGSQPGPKTS
jgi:hypothetical protein